VVARHPSRIGRYDVITSLATGGMGRIFLCRASGLGGFERRVVIKTLEVPITAETEAAIAMFLDEARLLGLLHHQHIASVFEVGRDEDRHYMVLDYVDGLSAHDVWERANQLGAALPLDFSLTVVSAAANGLHYAHTRKDTDGTPLGIVHRDVTPSNVMIGHDGAVKLIDFGIAMAAARKTKTQTGFVKGKVGYLSPEQVSGRDVDARTDVFALGILLYELTTLHRAFRESSDLATMQRIKAGKVVRPGGLVSGYPLELEAIVMKALEVDPRNRFDDADAMRRAIEALGHRLHFVLGDAAIIEVMLQLVEPQAAGASGQAPARVSDPAFEWVESDHDRTVRRDSQELLAAMRAENARLDGADGAGKRPDGEPRPRRLRAATEAADALVVQSVDAPAPPAPARSSSPPLPLSSPPPTPPPRLTGRGIAAQPAAAHPVVQPLVRPGTARPRAASVQPTPVTGSRLIGQSLVEARTQRQYPLRWLAALAVTSVLAMIGYMMTQESPSAVAGSASAVPPPVAARAPAPTPPPPAPPPVEPAAAPLPSTPTPATVRLQIFTRPKDATVLLDGKKLGYTPFDETIAAEPGKHVIKLRHRGYVTQRIDVVLDTDLRLERSLTRSK
jgi:eukaryotic-like serine/threonine-protein kinase